MAIIIDHKSTNSYILILSLINGTNIGKNDKNKKDIIKVDKEAEKLLKYINKSSSLDRTLLHKLFNKFNFNGTSMDLFSSVFYWRQIALNRTLDEFISAIRNMEEKIIFNYMYTLLLSIKLQNEDIELSNKDININLILDLLYEIEGDAEFKWYITEVCLDINKFGNVCADFLEKCVKILNKKLLAFDEKGSNLCEKLRIKTKNEGLDFVKDLMSDAFDEEKYKDKYIVPIVMYNHYLSINESLNSEDAIICIGEDFEGLNEMFSLKNQKEWVQNTLKYLSDDSRFKIMKVLTEEPSYGNKLADKLQLTSATISHHISVLYLDKLLKDVKHDGKYHFEIKNDSIDRFVDIFADEFKLDKLNLSSNGLGEKSSKYKINEEKLHEIIKCLSDKTRYEILKLLSEKDMYGEEISAELNLSGGNISYHGKALLKAGLINETRMNNRIYYCLNKEVLLKWLKLFETTFKSKY